MYKICGIQYGMNKFELADLILHHVYEAKEQNQRPDYTVEALTDDLNKYNHDLSATEEQVQNAVDYLYNRAFLTGDRRFEITPKGEDAVDSGLSVQKAARRTFETSPVNTTNTTINGGVNQFAQGNNNKLIQNNHVETAEDLLDKLIEFLKQNGETKIADEAKAVKESGGIRKTAKFIFDKAIGGFLTKLGQDGTQQVMGILGAITLALQH